MAFNLEVLNLSTFKEFQGCGGTLSLLLSLQAECLEYIAQVSDRSDSLDWHFQTLFKRLPPCSLLTSMPQLIGNCVCLCTVKTVSEGLCVPPLATEPSRRLLHLFGTVCRSQYGHRRHCKFFAADWRLSFLPGHTAALTKSVSLHWLPRDFTAILMCYMSLQS